MVPPMHATRINVPAIEQADDPLEPVDYVCIAADLLQQMFFELQALSVTYDDLAAAMPSHDSEMRDRLWALSQIADDLVSINDQALAATLMAQAVVLISSLSADIDKLAAFASIDEGHAHSDGSTLH